MSEIDIKQLLDGETPFYPQTDIHGLVNNGEYAIDDVPTIDSSNLVASGGVASELALGAVYDVTAHNGNAQFASLQALLTNPNLNTLIPTNIRRGGMSIKFVSVSDNKYVQCRLMTQNFTTDVTDWQGVDEEPTAGSDNLVKSGGVYKSIKQITGDNYDSSLLISGKYWDMHDAIIGGNAPTILSDYAAVGYSQPIEVKNGSKIKLYSYTYSPYAGYVRPIVIASKSTQTVLAVPSATNVIDYTETPFEYVCEEDVYLYLNCNLDHYADFSLIIISGFAKNIEDINNDIEDINNDIEDINQNLNNITPTQIQSDGYASIKNITLEAEVEDGCYYSQPDFGTTINRTESNDHSALKFNVNASKIYIIECPLRASSYRKNYFVCADENGNSVPGIQITELTQSTPYRYKFIVPEGTVTFITAKAKNEVLGTETKLFEIEEQKVLEWLKLNSGNITDDFVEQVASDVVESDELENKVEEIIVGKYYLCDSILKPIDFQGKKLVAFGDSITRGVASPNYIDAGENKYISKFCSYVGATLDNRAVSSTTIANNIKSQILSYNGDADIIWIAGGTNDYNTKVPIGNYNSDDTTTFYGSLKQICEHLKTNFSDRTIIFITPIPYTVQNYTPSNPTPLDAYRSAIYEVATSYGFNVVNGKDLGMPFNETPYGLEMCADKCHPTIKGHMLYARNLTNKLL